MFKFGEEHPVLFQIVLIVAAFAVAAVFTIIGSVLNLHPDLSTSAGRIIVSAALFILYKRAFKGLCFFTNPVLALPALLFAAWNIFYNISSGMVLGGVRFFVDGFIIAIAPAVFEEVLFREIFIYNLKKKGNSDWRCMFVSAIVFAAVHLTNLVGTDLASVALQVGYSFVIGLVFAAIYLKNESLLQIVAAHFLIDFTTSIFMELPSQTSNLQLVLFGLLLAAETIYAVMLTGGKITAEE